MIGFWVGICPWEILFVLEAGCLPSVDMGWSTLFGCYEVE